MKRFKKVKESGIFDHLFQCSSAIKFDDFSILATDCNNFKLVLRESLLMKRDKPTHFQQDHKIVSTRTL